jgi:hypothetical protein
MNKDNRLLAFVSLLFATALVTCQAIPETNEITGVDETTTRPRLYLHNQSILFISQMDLIARPLAMRAL